MFSRVMDEATNAMAHLLGTTEEDLRVQKSRSDLQRALMFQTKAS